MLLVEITLIIESVMVRATLTVRLGIKLALPDVEILEQFQPAVFQANKPPTNLTAYTNTTLSPTQPDKSQIMNQSI